METKPTIYPFNTFYNKIKYLESLIGYYQKNKDAFLNEYFIDYNRDISSVTNKEIETHFFQEKYDFESEYHWDCFRDDISLEFKKYIGKTICIKGNNLKEPYTFKLTETEDIFTWILPEDDEERYYGDYVQFHIFKLIEKEYKITIYHHDSPMEENYYLTIQ
jgi:hypothetical protein